MWLVPDAEHLSKELSKVLELQRKKREAEQRVIRLAMEDKARQVKHAMYAERKGADAVRNQRERAGNALAAAKMAPKDKEKPTSAQVSSNADPKANRDRRGPADGQVRRDGDRHQPADDKRDRRGPSQPANAARDRRGPLPEDPRAHPERREANARGPSAASGDGRGGGRQ
jgi:hypothetical protein